MNIAICDDEVFETEQLSALIDTYAMRRDYDIHCKCFHTGSDLLQEEKFDLYFLDYMIGDMNGVEVALALKAKFAQAVTICYLTNFESAATEVINHQVYADGFLKKPVDPQLLYEKLDRFYRDSFSSRVILKKGNKQQTVYTQEIMYIEADGKRSLLHTADEVLDFNYLLSEMERLFAPSNSFVRVHRSYMVNLSYVSSFDAKSLTLRGGITLPLKNKNFRAIYRDYLFSSQT
ncbi:MAG: response regulator transcription factor [Clostridia bacterium]|nr:response regulator transcription factor [Clostridia bacterium]